MLAERIFLRPDGRLRAGWRFVLFALCYMLLSSALGWLWTPEDFSTRMLWVIGQRLAITLAVSWAMLRWLEHKSLGASGIALARGWALGLGYGVLFGAALVTTTAGVLVVAAGVHFVPISEQVSATLFVALSAAAPVDGSAAVELMAVTPLLFLAAASEELLVRGYAFRLLIEGAGAPLAVAVNSIVFGLLHVLNPEAGILSAINTTLAGLLFSLICLRAGSLWYAIGAHFSWNWTLAALGMPVSGMEFPGLGWQAILPSGSEWLHGGAYGPEGGVVATVVLLAASLLIWCYSRQLGCRALTSDTEPAAEARVLAG